MSYYDGSPVEVIGEFWYLQGEWWERDHDSLRWYMVAGEYLPPEADEVAREVA